MTPGTSLLGWRTTPGPVAVTGSLVGALCAAAVPAFLTGALQGRIADELGIGVAGIGVSVAAFFVAAGTTSIPAGRVVDRIGAPLALRIGMAFAATASASIAVLATTHWHLTVLLMLAGVSLALVDTGGSRALSRAVPHGRQGVAFGTKEASGPLASLLAGLTLPVIGAHLGWRPAFVGAAVLAAVTGFAISSGLDRPRTSVDHPPRGGVGGGDRGADRADVRDTPPAGAEEPRDRRTAVTSAQRRPAAPPRPTSSTTPLLALLALAAASAGSVASSVATFLVPTGELAGLSPGNAGLVLSTASLASVAARILSGVAVDRRSGTELLAVAILAGIGSLGVIGLALTGGVLADQPGSGVLLVVAAVLALGGGWGWTGLLFLAGVRVEPRRPALSGGVVLAGLGLGGSGGPAAFGYLAEHLGFPTTWLIAAPLMASAAVVATVLRWRIRVRDESLEAADHQGSAGQPGPADHQGPRAG